MKNIAILLSGRGSNFLALSDAIEAERVNARIVLVLSNLSDAPGLQHAQERNYKTVCVPSKGIPREDYDRQVVNELKTAKTEFICLAGFMRLLSAWFVQQYPHRILNIHPSLLPSFPGLHAQRQALEWGAKVSGCTVHLVDEKLDHGPIIAQQTVPVHNDDTEETLSARILKKEHKIYPEALKLMCENRIRVENRRVITLPEK
jgi:phosphoribosylglycinamide formyltransferase-1